MGKTHYLRNAIILTLLLIPVSVALHEGIHWVQLKLDPDLEPAGFYLDGWTPFVQAKPERPMDSATFASTSRERMPMYEAEAYGAQFLLLGYPLWQAAAKLRGY